MNTRILYNHKSLSDVWESLSRIQGFPDKFITSMRLIVPSRDSQPSSVEVRIAGVVHSHHKNIPLTVSEVEIKTWSCWDMCVAGFEDVYSPHEVLHKWIRRTCSKEPAPSISSRRDFVAAGVRDTIKVECSRNNALSVQEVVGLVRRLLGVTSGGHLTWEMCISREIVSELFAPGFDWSDTSAKEIRLCYHLNKKEMIGGSGTGVEVLVESDASFELVTLVHDAIGIYYPCDPQTRRVYPFTLPLPLP